MVVRLRYIGRGDFPLLTLELPPLLSRLLIDQRSRLATLYIEGRRDLYYSGWAFTSVAQMLMRFVIVPLALGLISAAAEPLQAQNSGCTRDSTLGSAAATCPSEAAETSVPISVAKPASSESNGSSEPGTPPDAAIVGQPQFVESVCLAAAREAMANNLPAEFFTRLIWQESRFNSNAQSYKGAEGIAQFMPGTARWRGLANSFEPFLALREAARWLAELRDQFGNLGLAAAAYNAGPARIQNWLAHGGRLPNETEHYVRAVTGHSADEWSQHKVKDDAGPSFKIVPCYEIAKLFMPSSRRASVATAGNGSVNRAAWGPWGLQLIGNWSEARALSDYRAMQERFPTILGDKQPLVLTSRMASRGTATWYLVRVAESTKERAIELCRKLESAGGKCLVFKN